MFRRRSGALSCRSGSFFFQAEDGIRDLYVTGVQTCALPIFDAEKLLVTSAVLRLRRERPAWFTGPDSTYAAVPTSNPHEIGRASCRERVYISVGAAAV